MIAFSYWPLVSHLCPLHYLHSGPRTIFQRCESDSTHLRFLKFECLYSGLVLTNLLNTVGDRPFVIVFETPGKRLLPSALTAIYESSLGFSTRVIPLLIQSLYQSQECFTFSQIHQMAAAVFSVRWVRRLSPQ